MTFPLGLFIVGMFVVVAVIPIWGFVTAMLDRRGGWATSICVGFIAFPIGTLAAIAYLAVIRRRTRSDIELLAVGPVSPTPGWFPDPTGQHESRYWDGEDWTGRVID
ncbi:MAG: DUF2510 domain-containing protein [Acidimicrobiales bacterium]|nr:DUF2510 domain-containing protein [Acidimicrobiales bacterium]